MGHFFIHLKKELKKHTFDYILLVTAGVFFIALLNFYKGERLPEFIIVSFFVSFYILWGIYHHTVDDDIHLKIVVEYVLIGLVLMLFFKLIILP
ncbi:hypothetical protein HYW87_00970 [Candidatus Roizmanbacteria bacterium]|nr:hypothetical protein [Candidatus Roizmanbacteria bacterium]